MSDSAVIDLSSSTPPRGERARAFWLLGRNPWAAGLVRRAIGADPLQDVLVEYEGVYWPGELAVVVAEHDKYRAALEAYEADHPRPSPFGADEAAFDRAYDAWEAAGPAFPVAAKGLVGMSSGEMRAVRCLAALGGPVQFEAWDLRSLVGSNDDATLAVDVANAYLAPH